MREAEREKRQVYEKGGGDSRDRDKEGIKKTDREDTYTDSHGLRHSKRGRETKKEGRRERKEREKEGERKNVCVRE